MTTKKYNRQRRRLTKFANFYELQEAVYWNDDFFSSFLSKVHHVSQFLWKFLGTGQKKSDIELAAGLFKCLLLKRPSLNESNSLAVEWRAICLNCRTKKPPPISLRDWGGGGGEGGSGDALFYFPICIQRLSLSPLRIPLACPPGLWISRAVTLALNPKSHCLGNTTFLCLYSSSIGSMTHLGQISILYTRTSTYLTECIRENATRGRKETSIVQGSSYSKSDFNLNFCD